MPIKQAVILAGGKSSRFESNKVYAKLGDKTLLQHVVQNLETAGFSIFLSINKGNPLSHEYPVIFDEEAHKGPLSAIQGILNKIEGTSILVTCCDMPHTSDKAYQMLFELHKAENLITCFKDKLGKVHPFPGVYSKKLLLAIQKQIATKDHSLMALIKKSQPSILSCLSDNDLRNVNYADDL